MKTVVEAYNYSKIYRFLIMYWCCGCESNRKQLKNKMFMGKWLHVKKAGIPD